MTHNTTFERFFHNKTVFVTGHTGFIGSWLSFWLSSIGANVIGYSFNIPTEPSNFEILNLKNKIKHYTNDINKQENLQSAILENEPEIIIHLAAQSLVTNSYENTLDTIQTNVMGTANVLEAIKHSPSVKVCVIMTSDKCYENKEIKYAYKETDPLGGYDPYSASKGAAEIITSSYRNSFFNPTRIHEHHVSLATVRAGNVIGGGDWAKNRLVSDCVNALSKNEEILIRNPNAIRPWQHVLEPISGIFCLIYKMWEEPVNYSQAWNFGPITSNPTISVSELVSKIISRWGTGNWKKISDYELRHEANLLMLDSTKANQHLKWNPIYSIDEAINETVKWYIEYFKHPQSMEDFTQQQINEYVQKGEKLNLSWTQ